VKSSIAALVAKPFANWRLAHASSSIDAFLVSYPKSGRTWFRYILASYFSRYFAGSTDVNLTTCFSLVPNFDFDSTRGLPSYWKRSWPAQMPLVAVSHHPYSSRLFGRGKLILMVRDPRDVMVSAYFHETRHKRRYSGDMPAFLRDGQFGIASVVRYLNGWAGSLSGREHVVVQYESLFGDAFDETQKVLRLLGCPIDSEQLTAAIDASRFEAMRESEIATGIPGHNYDRGDPESLRMRRGKAHGYKEYLSATDEAYIMAHCRNNLSAAAKAVMEAGQQRGA